jgi:hypothetical protein
MNIEVKVREARRKAKQEAKRLRKLERRRDKKRKDGRPSPSTRKENSEQQRTVNPAYHLTLLKWLRKLTTVNVA